MNLSSLINSIKNVISWPKDRFWGSTSASSVQTPSVSSIYPIQTMADGRTRWSDGSITGGMSSQLRPDPNSILPETTSLPSVTTAPNTSGSSRTESPSGGSSPVSTITPALPNNSMQNVNDVIVNAWKNFTDNYAAKSKEFDANNPFVFDEILAKKRTEVSSRLDPYYNQTLGDFLHGINLKRSRGLADERTLLSNLNADVTTYTGKNKQLLEDAVDQSGQGFADAGLFFSGAAMRDEGKTRSSSGQDLSNYLQLADRSSKSITQNYNRGIEDINLEEAIKKRDINQQRYATVEFQALNETNLAQARRNLEKSQFLGAPFSGGSLSTLSTDFSKYI